MVKRWIVTALGKDRPGIVAGVTKSLFELGCNLEDSAMTRLEGEFTIMLIFTAPSGLSQTKLLRAFQPLQRRLALSVHLKPLTRAETTAAPRGRPYLISVYGADRPGIVYRVSQLLARLGVNITDVHTHRTPEAKRVGTKALYLLLLEVEIPAQVGAKAVERRLHELASRLRVELSIRSAEPSVL